jgi:Fe-S-cluster-containing dehydrogenase component
MPRTSLMFFKDDCMGCHACEVACKQEHNLGVGPRLVRVIENSPYFTPVYCHHCTRAPCQEACPVEAIYSNDQGLVLLNQDKCIGCLECLPACPFGAMQFDDESELAMKCDLCVERIQDGLGPACAAVCGTGCIRYGDGRKLSQEVAERI